MRHIQLSLILIATLFLANGCTLDRGLKTYNGVSVQELGYISGVAIEGSFPAKGNLAVTINGNLSSKYGFQVVSVNGATVGGIRQVQIGLMGSNRKPVLLEYRASWFDASGKELEGQALGWSPLPMDGKVFKTVTVVPKTTQAQSFRVSIRKKLN